MANPWTGEVTLMIDGQPYTAKLTLGALAELEQTLGEGIVDLVTRFEEGHCRMRDVMAVLVAGLRGGGWQGSAADLRKARFDGGPMQAAQNAALLLVRAFGEDAP